MQAPTIEDFAGWINLPCNVTAREGEARMTLVAAEPLPHSPRQGGGFRLEFLGPTNPVFGQAIMTVSGPDATHDIFLVPIGQDAEGTRYEAIFY